jgi:hypothetical protein
MPHAPVGAKNEINNNNNKMYEEVDKSVAL